MRRTTLSEKVTVQVLILILPTGVVGKGAEWVNFCLHLCLKYSPSVWNENRRTRRTLVLKLRSKRDRRKYGMKKAHSPTAKS